MPSAPLASTFRAPSKPPQVVEDTLPKRERVRARGWKPVEGGVLGEEEPGAAPGPVTTPTRRTPVLTLVLGFLAVGGLIASAIVFVVKPWGPSQPAATPVPTPFAFVPTPTLVIKATPTATATPAESPSAAEPTATP